MSQPKKAFNEVRAILGKLDRSREELRQRPGGSENPPPTPAQAPPASTPTPAPTQAPRLGTPVQAAPARPVTPPSPGSKYGRAQPIRPSGEALGRWNPPSP